MLGMETKRHIGYHYEWREKVDGRLLAPCSDPNVHETAFDFVFDTVDQAIDAIGEWGMPYDPETWVLLLVMETSVELASDERTRLAQQAFSAELLNAYGEGGSDAVFQHVRENHPDWRWDYCPCCEDHVPVLPDSGTDYCAVCWQVL